MQKYKVFGLTATGKQPSENCEMATFFNALRLEFPSLYKVAIHVKNEGKRTYQQISADKSRGGFVKGASDIIIPGNPTFVCELKSRSKSSRISVEQSEYLNNCFDLGCFSCLCYGYEAAIAAVKWWDTNHVAH